VIITEHNSDTAADWDTVANTADTWSQASRLSSQVVCIVGTARITMHFIFKFAIAASFTATRDVIKNGLHWGDIYNYPYNLADTTLSAEALRLTTTLKNAQAVA
jgi:hypothetical protein